MSDPFAPPQADLTPTMAQREGGHALDPDAWPAVRNRALLRSLAVVPLSLIVFYFMGPLDPFVLGGIVVGLLLVVGLSVGLRLRRAARLWPLLRYHHDNETVSVLGAPEIQRTLHKDDIRSVTETARGLVIQGREFAETVVVPKEVVDYDGFRARLIGWERFDPERSGGLAAWWPQLASSGALWLALLILISENTWVITVGSPVVVILCLYRLFRIVSTSALSFRVKLLNVLVLGYLAFAIAIRFLALGQWPNL